MLAILSRLAAMSADELARLTPQQKADITQQLRLPDFALDRLVPSEQREPHFQNRRPVARSVAKGLHPRLYALLRDCAQTSISGIDPTQLKTKHVADQLRAICKHHVYEQLAAAIDEIWAALQPVLDGWQRDANSNLGTVREVPADNGRASMMLVALGDAEKAALDNSASIEALFGQLMHYTRGTWGAAIMQWSQQSVARRNRARYLPRYLTQTTDPVPFAENLLRGVNTAIKIIYSINYLLLKLSGRIESRQDWHALQEDNYSFAALWAAGSITTLESLTGRFVFDPDPATVEYLTKAKIISPTSWRPGQPGFEMLDPAYFQLSQHDQRKRTLDLAESRMPQIRACAVQADVVVMKCPALKIGVVKSMYDWINRIVTEAIESAGLAPWPAPEQADNS